MLSVKLLSSVARVVANVASGGAAGVVAEIGTSIFEVVWDRWSNRSNAKERRAEIEELVAAPLEGLHARIDELIEEEIADQPEDVKQLTRGYLKAIPAQVRATFRRPSDPGGHTVPATLALTNAFDLLPLLPPRTPRFLPGDRPVGDFELVRLVGVGGFGEVWEARNIFQSNAPHVALKFCLDESKQKTLRHESGILNRLISQGHLPGIVRLEQTFLSNDPPCLQYELIEGGDLSGLLVDRDRIPAEEARTIIRRLAEILQGPHSLNPPVVHRDLKPANIFLRVRSGEGYDLLIGDFGIGGLATEEAVEEHRLSRSASLTRSVHGAYTPLYASPQQSKAEPPRPGDDIFSLGVIWFQLLTGDLGSRPGPDWRDELEDLGVSEGDCDLIGRCLKKNPERRLGNAMTVLERLEPKSVERTPPVFESDDSTGGDDTSVRTRPSRRKQTRSKPPTSGRGRTINVPGDAATISRALRRARPGDTILLQSGDYQESFTLPNDVSLKGTDRDGCLLKPAPGSDQTIEITGGNGSIESLTLEGTDIKGSEENTPHGITISGGTPTVKDCLVIEFDGCGIFVRNEGTAPKLLDNSCSQNKMRGISFEHQSGGEARNNECYANSGTGISVFNEGTTVVLDGNHVEQNKLSGISFEYGAAGEARGNTCEENGQAGIAVFNEGTTPLLTENICRKNEGNGIGYHKGAGGRAVRNTCEENEKCGIACLHEGTAPELVKNNCSSNTMSGITFEHAACGRADRNTCDHNTQGGIICFNEGTAPELHGNICRHNTLRGIGFEKGAGGTAVGNTCDDNGGDGITCFNVGTNPTLTKNICRDNGGWGIDMVDDGSWTGSENVAEGNTAGQIREPVAVKMRKFFGYTPPKK